MAEGTQSDGGFDMNEHELRELSRSIAEMMREADPDRLEGMLLIALRSIEATTRMRCHRVMQECAVRVASMDRED